MSGSLFPSSSVEPLGHGQLSVSSATPLGNISGGIPPKSNYALIQVSGNVDVNWTDSGTAPSGNVGMTIYAAEPPQGFVQAQLPALKFAATPSGTALVSVSFYQMR